MIVFAKELVKNKFWLLEDEGENIGTLSWNDDYYMLSDGNSSPQFLRNKRDVSKTIGKRISWKALTITETVPNEIYGYDTRFTPYNAMYDVQRKLPLYTKSANSRSYFCAGYYIVEFEKGWVRRDFPKLLTLMRNNYRGPYKTKIEQKLHLEAANAKR